MTRSALRHYRPISRAYYRAIGFLLQLNSAKHFLLSLLSKCGAICLTSNLQGKKPNVAKISRQNDSSSMISKLARGNFSRRGRKATRVGNGSGWCLTMKWSPGLLQRLIKTKRGRLLSALIIKFKLENIKAHELSKSNILFYTCFDNQNKPVADTQAGVCVQQLASAQREKVMKPMRNAHAVAKHCAPFTHYELMCK